MYDKYSSTLYLWLLYTVLIVFRVIVLVIKYILYIHSTCYVKRVNAGRYCTSIGKFTDMEQLL